MSLRIIILHLIRLSKKASRIEEEVALRIGQEFCHNSVGGSTYVVAVKLVLDWDRKSNNNINSKFKTQ